MTNNGTFVSDIKAKKAYKSLDYHNNVTSEYSNTAYPHLTFQVNSVVEYLQIVNILSKTKREDFVNGEIIYRGMADKDWKLLPSLGRYDDLSDGQEYNLVNNFLALRPEAFQNLNSNFEILSKMQHYELPTRLLDFTTNPLIALFFACSELSNKKDARIVCHRAYVEISKNPIIEAICGFYNYFTQEDIKLDDIKIPPQKYLRKLYYQKDDRLLVARPFYWNERIQRQAAIFMVFPNRLHDKYGLWAYGGRVDYKGHWENEKYRSSLEVVENEPLKKMYKEADKRNLDVTHLSITELFKFYEKETNQKQLLTNWEIPFKERFEFRSEIQAIDLDTMKKEFCSIIIDKRKKNSILQELRTFGIDESYVYPELQYTARKLKKIFLP